MVYSDPDNLMVFFDNHDVDRAMLVANGNIDKYKIVLNIVLFTRGIPNIFYGTELGITGGKKHGELRQPFPGGFAGDDRNAFTMEGRTETENDLYNYVNELFKLRNKYPSLSKGKLRHIYPAENIYVLIKSYEDEMTLVLINSNEEEISIEPSTIKSFLPEVKTLVNLQSKEKFDLSSAINLSINKMTAEIFLIRK
jgi:glycosidase